VPPFRPPPAALFECRPHTANSRRFGLFYGPKQGLE
jgi:hypothetical protein